MKENVFRYEVKEINSGVTEERLICGATKGATHSEAIKAYEDDENWEITKSEFAGVLEYEGALNELCI